MSIQDEILQHYGVVGMKWGRRKAAEIKTRRTEVKTQKAVNKQRKKDYETRYKLSDNELRNRVNRMQLESNYARLIAEQSVSSRKRAQGYVDSMKVANQGLNEVRKFNKTTKASKRVAKFAASLL